MICKFNEKGSAIPYKMVSYIGIEEMETVQFSMNTKAKSGIVIILHGEGTIQLNAKDTEEAKTWVTGILLFLTFFLLVVLIFFLLIEIQLALSQQRS